jgi:hypothetical protein
MYPSSGRRSGGQAASTSPAVPRRRCRGSAGHQPSGSGTAPRGEELADSGWCQPSASVLPGLDGQPSLRSRCPVQALWRSVPSGRDEFGAGCGGATGTTRSVRRRWREGRASKPPGYDMGRSHHCRSGDRGYASRHLPVAIAESSRAAGRDQLHPVPHGERRLVIEVRGTVQDLGAGENVYAFAGKQAGLPPWYPGGPAAISGGLWTAEITGLPASRGGTSRSGLWPRS